MLKGKSIVCMPLTSWDSEFPNTLIQLAHILSRDNKVLLIDYQFTWKDVYSGLRGKRKVPLKRMFGFENRLRKVNSKFGTELFVLTLPAIVPYNRIKWKWLQLLILKLNSMLVLRPIRKTLRSLAIQNPILLNGYNPFLGYPLVGKFDEMANVYFCYDEISGDKYYSGHGPFIEQLYLAKTDCVVVTSDALYDSKSKFHCKCHVVKNGVDFELFNSVTALSKSVYNYKIVGYAGSIDERFDLEIVRYAVESLPEVRFLFVGRVTNNEAKQALEKYSNVEFKGSQLPEKVPQFIKDMDVCIIPYVRNEVTRGVYPLKINEYLAAGKPVVMTDFAEISELKAVVKVSISKEDFLNSLNAALTDNSNEDNIRRIDFARKNSWHQKAEELSEIIEGLKVKGL